MKIELDAHPIQANILKKLLFQPEAKYTELNVQNISTDHFNFHVKKLIEVGVIEKRGDLYILTIKGKEIANRFDTERLVVEKQAKVSVLLICIKDEGGVKYLIQQRLKQPYYGFYGFVGGKVKWGETIEEAATRELKEETGLSGDLELFYVKHKMDYSKKNVLLEDKYFFICKVTNTNGVLVEKFEGGWNLWLPQEAIEKLPNLFHGVLDILEKFKNGDTSFLEKKYIVSRY